jgi:hypothetical protein
MYSMRITMNNPRRRYPSLISIQCSFIFKKPVSDSSKAPKKNHQKQTTKNNHTQKQVYINKTKTVHHIPKTAKIPKT